MSGAYHWLVAQGLWPALVSSALYWLVPTVLAGVLSVRTLRRAYRELTGLWRDHIAASRAQTAALCRLHRALIRPTPTLVPDHREAPRER